MTEGREIDGLVPSLGRSSSQRAKIATKQVREDRTAFHLASNHPGKAEKPARGGKEKGEWRSQGKDRKAHLTCNSRMTRHQCGPTLDFFGSLDSILHSVWKIVLGRGVAQGIAPSVPTHLQA